MNTQRGIALVLVILVTSFLSAIGLGLAMIVIMDRLAGGNLRGSVAMLFAADAALELAVRDLARLDDWDLALAGVARSAFADGEPSGVRAIPGGGVIDLTAATNYLNCNRSTECAGEQMAASSRERPWGDNNARWRLYAYGPVSNFVQFSRGAPGYLAVWVADDGREQDGNPAEDAAPDSPGHGVLRVRAAAHGALGVRRVIEGELARLCLDAETPCRRGIRVQSWQEVRESVP
jgi:hypothetical protein